MSLGPGTVFLAACPTRLALEVIITRTWAVIVHGRAPEGAAP